MNPIIKYGPQGNAGDKMICDVSVKVTLTIVLLLLKCVYPKIQTMLRGIKNVNAAFLQVCLSIFVAKVFKKPQTES